MIDPNETSVSELTKQVTALPLGSAIVMKDGLSLRRRSHQPGWELVAGRSGRPLGGWLRTPGEAVTALLDQSARSSHADSLGGEIQFKSATLAIDALEDGYAVAGKHFPADLMSQVSADRKFAKVSKLLSYRDEPAEGAAPVVDDTDVNNAISALIREGQLPSYKSRGHLAMQAVKKGDLSAARNHIEAVVAHSVREGNARSEALATEALITLRQTYPDAALQPVDTPEEFKVRTIEGEHFIYQGTRRVGVALSSRSEAEARAKFQNKRARQATGVAEIDQQEQKGDPIVVAAGGLT